MSLLGFGGKGKWRASCAVRMMTFIGASARWRRTRVRASSRSFRSSPSTPTPPRSFLAPPRTPRASWTAARPVRRAGALRAVHVHARARRPERRGGPKDPRARPRLPLGRGRWRVRGERRLRAGEGGDGRRAWRRGSSPRRSRGPEPRPVPPRDSGDVRAPQLHVELCVVPAATPGRPPRAPRGPSVRSAGTRGTSRGGRREARGAARRRLTRFAARGVASLCPRPAISNPASPASTSPSAARGTTTR